MTCINPDGYKFSCCKVLFNSVNSVEGDILKSLKDILGYFELIILNNSSIFVFLSYLLEKESLSSTNLKVILQLFLSFISGSGGGIYFIHFLTN